MIPYLERNDEEEDAAGDLDLLPHEDHGHAAELPDEVDDDEEGGEEPSAAPGDVHVLALLVPLHPHPDAVLEEGRDEAEARDVRQEVLRAPGHLEKDGQMLL